MGAEEIITWTSAFPGVGVVWREAWSPPPCRVLVTRPFITNRSPERRVEGPGLGPDCGRSWHSWVRICEWSVAAPLGRGPVTRPFTPNRPLSQEWYHLHVEANWESTTDHIVGVAVAAPHH